MRAAPSEGGGASRLRNAVHVADARRDLTSRRTDCDGRVRQIVEAARVRRSAGIGPHRLRGQGDVADLFQEIDGQARDRRLPREIGHPGVAQSL